MTETRAQTGIEGLEERTYKFSRSVLVLSKKLNKNVISIPLVSQLIRSATSVGANYREANEAVSKKDFIHRMHISRKECKETSYWLELLKIEYPDFMEDLNFLIDESRQLRNIFTAIINKTS